MKQLNIAFEAMCNGKQGNFSSAGSAGACGLFHREPGELHYDTTYEYYYYD